MNEEKEVVLNENRAMVYLPEDAVEVRFEAKVYHDGELITAQKILTMGDLREAFRKADEGYIDDDDVFVVTEKGKKWLEKRTELFEEREEQ